LRLLLETHAFWRWLDDDRLLSASARGVIADPSNDFLVSAASIWEIAKPARCGPSHRNGLPRSLKF
jgi:PIN domain nuclease of toxin-antitoxin system